MFALTETVLHLSDQLGVLDVLADSILGHIELSFRVYIWVRPLPN